jgi:hypothetical protein
MTNFNVRLIHPDSVDDQLLKIEFIPANNMDMDAFRARIDEVIKIMPVGSLQKRDELKVEVCKDHHTTIFFRPLTTTKGLELYWQAVGTVAKIHNFPTSTSYKIEYEGEITQLMYTSMTFALPV